MKRILFCMGAFSLLSAGVGAAAQTYMDNDTYVSDDVISEVRGLPIVRQISGGTVFSVRFTGNCPLDMQGAVEHACRIVEEIIPPATPITVTVDLGSGTPSTPLSRVYSRVYSDFSCEVDHYKALAPEIKHSILGEYECLGTFQYVSSIGDESFFNDPANPDIRLVYNRSRMGECSFSIDEQPGEKYDFVSVVIRDLLKGLGFASSYRADTSAKTILDIDNYNTTPFDAFVRGALIGGPAGTPYANATSGGLEIYSGLSLYAPAQWQQGVSLNYFIPTDKYKLSQVLTSNFGKGTVTRDITDPKNSQLFKDLLYWVVYMKSGPQPSSSGSGSNAVVMPYQGDITLNGELIGGDVVSVEVPDNTQTAGDPFGSEKNFIFEYLLPFHVNYRGEGISTDTEGHALSILKKDGTWDCVAQMDYGETDEVTYKFSDLEFHCDPAEYARTPEGYLRCRNTLCTIASFGGATHYRKYRANYFVMDWLPEPAEIALWTDPASAEGQSKAPVVTADGKVKFALKNLEGVTRVVLMSQREGSRVPNKTELKDIHSGTAELSLPSGAKSKVTVVTYNANGSTTGQTIEVDLSE